MMVLPNIYTLLSRRLNTMLKRFLCAFVCAFAMGSESVVASDYFSTFSDIVSNMASFIAPETDIRSTEDESYPDVIIESDESLSHDFSNFNNDIQKFEQQKRNFTEYVQKFKQDYQLVHPCARMDYDIISRVWYLFYKVHPDPSHQDWNIDKLLPYLIEEGFLTDNGLLPELSKRNNKFEFTSVLCMKLDIYFNKLLLLDKTQEEKIACFKNVLEEILLWNRKYVSFWAQQVDCLSGQKGNILMCEYIGKNLNILFPDYFLMARIINPSDMKEMSTEQIGEQLLDELKEIDFYELLATYAESERN